MGSAPGRLRRLPCVRINTSSSCCCLAAWAAATWSIAVGRVVACDRKVARCRYGGDADEPWAPVGVWANSPLSLPKGGSPPVEPGGRDSPAPAEESNPVELPQARVCCTLRLVALSSLSSAMADSVLGSRESWVVQGEGGMVGVGSSILMGARRNWHPTTSSVRYRLTKNTVKKSYS